MGFVFFEITYKSRLSSYFKKKHGILVKLWHSGEPHRHLFDIHACINKRGMPNLFNFIQVILPNMPGDDFSVILALGAHIKQRTVSANIRTRLIELIAILIEPGIFKDLIFRTEIYVEMCGTLSWKP